jgi:hypothetical protein
MRGWKRRLVRSFVSVGVFWAQPRYAGPCFPLQSLARLPPREIIAMSYRRQGAKAAGGPLRGPRVRQSPLPYRRRGIKPLAALRSLFVRQSPVPHRMTVTERPDSKNGSQSTRMKNTHLSYFHAEITQNRIKARIFAISII